MASSYRGSIKLIIGPMFSGKTTELLRLIKRGQSVGKNALCIKYYKDNRFTDSDNIVSRDNISDRSTNAIKSCGNNLGETIKTINVNNYDIIAIDEIQFYTDGAEICDYLANCGHDVYVSGLSGTSDRKPFNTISLLVPLVEDIVHLKALDKKSKTECAFTKRLVSDTEIELIGNDIYEPVNRLNYFTSSSS